MPRTMARMDAQTRARLSELMTEVLGLIERAHTLKGEELFALASVLTHTTIRLQDLLRAGRTTDEVIHSVLRATLPVLSELTDVAERILEGKDVEDTDERGRRSDPAGSQTQ